MAHALAAEIASETRCLDHDENDPSQCLAPPFLPSRVLRWWGARALPFFVLFLCEGSSASSVLLPYASIICCEASSVVKPHLDDYTSIIWPQCAKANLNLGSILKNDHFK